MDQSNIPPPPGAGVRYGEIKPHNASQMLQAGVAAGNIVRQSEGETLDLPVASSEQLQKQQALVQDFELKRKMKSLVVPTADGEVRQMLRHLQEPMTLFGEREVRKEYYQEIDFRTHIIGILRRAKLQSSLGLTARCCHVYRWSDENVYESL